MTERFRDAEEKVREIMNSAELAEWRANQLAEQAKHDKKMQLMFKRQQSAIEEATKLDAICNSIRQGLAQLQERNPAIDFTKYRLSLGSRGNYGWIKCELGVKERRKY